MKTIVLIRWNMPFEGSRYEDRISRITSDSGWNFDRMCLFMSLTAPSLQRQSLKDFSVWLICDPAKGIQNEELNGLLSGMSDDRFRIVTDFDAEVRREMRGIPGHEKILFARIDSDDMYHHDLLSKFVFESGMTEKRYVQAMLGCAYQIESGKFFYWDNPSPPFFADIRRVSDLEFGYSDNPLKINHGSIATLSHKIIDAPMFCVTLHRTNICNSTASPWIQNEIGEQESELLMEEYGIQ